MTQEQDSNSADDPTRQETPEHTVILDVPRELGSYKLTRLLGRGGMGEVWQAFDTNLERDVAIKLMRKELLANEDATRRFFREARAVARLNHPNIVQVYTFGDEKGLNYFVMELVEGETVSQALKKHKKIPLEEALHIMLQAIEGLGYANARGIIHRDIKPSNLMITDDSRVKIADFGLAKSVEHDTQMTVAGTAMGSPNYMSPEQARGEEADHRSDIYALGVSLYQMLCGTLPFTAHSPVSVLLKQIQEPLPENEIIKCLNDGAVLDVIKKMTAKTPDGRYQTYGQLAEALGGLQPNVHIKGAHHVTASLPAATPVSSPGPGEDYVGSAEISPISGTPPTRAESLNSAVTPATPSGPAIISSKDITAGTPLPFAAQKPRNGLLIAGLATLAILCLAILAWWAFGKKSESTAGENSNTASNSTIVQPADASATPVASPSPAATAAPATPSPSPVPGSSQTPAPKFTPPVHLTPVGSQPVNISVLITPAPTPLPTVTPIPDINKLMPSGINSDAPAAAQVVVLGIQGSASREPIQAYTDANGRTPLKQLQVGSEATLIGDGPVYVRVIPAGDNRPVYVLKKMTYPKP